MADSEGVNTRLQCLAAAVLLGCALWVVQPAAGQEPIDGACDDSVRNGCAAGTANDDAFPDQPNAYVWRCDGLHGGTNSEKCAKFVAVDGVCDDSVRNGCAAGRANDAVFPNYPTVYVWRCDGLYGGTNSSKCAKFVAVDGVCDETRRNGCAAGTANDAVFPNSPTTYAWRCDGQFGGANSEKCSKSTAVDGGWSDWGACSATACGAEGKRIRTCNNPSPEHGGQECLRQDGTRGAAETRPCTGAEAVDGGWSAWSACSVSACDAVGTQTRTCDNPAPGCGGSTCSGSSSRACKGRDARDGVWQTGAWGSWSACSGSICNRSRSRSVSCTPAACGGAACDESSKPAQTQTSACPSPAWQTGAWSDWSSCSATACGATGQQTRTRTVSCPCGTACAGPKPAATETQSCTGGDARDGVWETGAWGSWSACSGSICNRSRSRSVSCTPAACGGAACDESSKPAQTQTSACPSPAWQTGAWSDWSSCSATACGATGQQTRTRTVSCPCGTACAGTAPASSETQACTGNNPRHGVWQTGAWGSWSVCDSSTCQQSRRRPVSCALPGCGGNACDEDSKPSPIETRQCSNPPNPAWERSPWSGWSSCSATACGVPGHQIRTRTVSCPCGSSSCPTPKPAERETQSCTGNNPEDGKRGTLVDTCLAGDATGIGEAEDTALLQRWRCVGKCGGSTAYGEEPWPPCSGKTLEWGSDCSATATTTLTGASVNLTNNASCRAGSATFACNKGNWGSATNPICTTTPVNGRCSVTTTGCAAGTRQNVTETASLLSWSCLGSCEGTDAQCYRIKELSVSISVSSASGQGTATATVSGGTAPYIYSWNVLGADMEEGSSSGASITFSYRRGVAPTAVHVSVEVRDSAGLFGSASSNSSSGTPPGP